MKNWYRCSVYKFNLKKYLFIEICFNKLTWSILYTQEKCLPVTYYVCRWRCQVNNSGLYMFDIDLSETKCLQGMLIIQGVPINMGIQCWIRYRLLKIILWFSLVIPTEKAVICKSFVCYIHILFVYVLTAYGCT